jgi:hypothetical protein
MLLARGVSGRWRTATGGLGMAGTPWVSVLATGVACRVVSAGADGNGCLGPERIWPGLGEVAPAAGNGFAAGITGRPGAITAAGGAAGGLTMLLGAGALGAGGAGMAGRPNTGGWIGRPASGGRIGAACAGCAAVRPSASAEAESWAAARGALCAGSEPVAGRAARCVSSSATAGRSVGSSATATAPSPS